MYFVTLNNVETRLFFLVLLGKACDLWSAFETTCWSRAQFLRVVNNENMCIWTCSLTTLPTEVWWVLVLQTSFHDAYLALRIGKEQWYQTHSSSPVSFFIDHLNKFPDFLIDMAINAYFFAITHTIVFLKKKKNIMKAL